MIHGGRRKEMKYIRWGFNIILLIVCFLSLFSIYEYKEAIKDYKEIIKIHKYTINEYKESIETYKLVIASCEKTIEGWKNLRDSYMGGRNQ